MRKILIAVFVLSAGWSSAEPAGSSAARFLMVEPLAREAAMGGAYAASASGAGSLYSNPAGLGGLEEGGVIFSHLFYFEGLNCAFFSYAEPVGNLGVFSAGAMALYSDRVDRTREDSLGYLVETSDTFSSLETAFMLGWGGNIISGKLDAGLSVKIINQRIDNSKAGGFGADLGAKYFFREDITFGAGIQNIGPPIKGKRLPLNFKAGAGWDVPGYPVIVAADINQPLDGDFSFNLGAEGRIHGLLSLRAGYGSRSDTDGLSGVHTGFGVEWNRLSFDYAFIPYGDLGDTHSLTLGTFF